MHLCIAHSTAWHRAQNSGGLSKYMWAQIDQREGGMVEEVSSWASVRNYKRVSLPSTAPREKDDKCPIAREGSGVTISWGLRPQSKVLGLRKEWGKPTGLELQNYRAAQTLSCPAVGCKGGLCPLELEDPSGRRGERPKLRSQGFPPQGRSHQEHPQGYHPPTAQPVPPFSPALAGRPRLG